MEAILLNYPRLNDIAPSTFPMTLIVNFRMCCSLTPQPERLSRTPEVKKGSVCRRTQREG